MDPDVEPEGVRVVPATDHKLGYWLVLEVVLVVWARVPIPLELGICRADQLS